MDTVLFRRSTKNGSTHQLISVHTERLCMRLHQQHLVATYLLTTVGMAVKEIKNKCAHIIVRLIIQLIIWENVFSLVS